MNELSEQPGYELAQELTPYLPKPIERESVYGWCARYHRLAGGINPLRTSRILYGMPGTGLNHDFPVNLRYFQQVTNDLLGPTDEVMRMRTLYGFHAPFISADLAARLTSVMLNRQGISARIMLGLNKYAAVPAPLKACPDCIAEQWKALGTTTWDALLQWPTVLVCPQHNKLLLTLRPEHHLPRLQDFLIPGDICESAWLPIPAISQEDLSKLINVGQWTETLVNQPRLHLDATFLRNCYLLQAKERGWLAMDGSLRLQALRDAFEKWVKPFVKLPGLIFLADVQGPNAGFLGPLLRQYPGYRHPAKHIFLQQFLFPSPEDFLAKYGKVKAIVEADGHLALKAMLKDTQRTLVQLVGLDHRSVNSAAAELDIPPAQAIRHLKKQGVSYQCRPRIQASVKSQLEALLKSGMAKSQIAAALKIRVGYIKDYLTQRPELRHDWNETRRKQQASAYRAHFLKVLEENPGVPIKRIRRIPGNGFEWLYRNDRNWLASNLPGIWRRPP